MIEFFRKNSLPLAVMAGLIAALTVPHIGIMLKARNLVVILTMLVFFCQGLGFDATGARKLTGWFAISFIGLITSQLLAPLLGWVTVHLLGWQEDRAIGFLIICCMAPTLVSGTVIAVSAGGDRGVSLFLTITLNLVSIVLIPLNLRWVFGSTVDMNEWLLLKQLTITVLLPGLAGQLFRKTVPRSAEFSNLLHYVPILCLGLIIFLSTSSQVARLQQTKAMEIVSIILPALLVHYLLFVFAWYGSRWRKLPRHVRTAISFVCAQKTLPVAIIVWQQLFADTYTMAVIPPIVFHLGQIYGDSFLARWIKRGKPGEVSVLAGLLRR
jgi:predicted Na+-dependent transporter